MFKRSLMLLAVVAISCLSAACTTLAPDATGVAAIKSACNLDAAARPTIDLLLAMPGLATAQEQNTVTVARSVIDPICNNPGGTFQDNALAIVSANAGKIAAVLTALQERKSQPVPSPAPAASATVSMAEIPRRALS